MWIYMSVMPHSRKKYPRVLAAQARWVLKKRECFENFLLQFLCILYKLSEHSLSRVLGC